MTQPNNIDKPEPQGLCTERLLQCIAHPVASGSRWKTYPRRLQGTPLNAIHMREGLNAYGVCHPLVRLLTFLGRGLRGLHGSNTMPVQCQRSLTNPRRPAVRHSRSKRCCSLCTCLRSLCGRSVSTHDRVHWAAEKSLPEAAVKTDWVVFLCPQPCWRHVRCQREALTLAETSGDHLELLVLALRIVDQWG